MRRLRGFTLTEMVCATFLMFMVISGTVALLISSSQGLANGVASNKTTSYNAQGLRYISEALRSAMSVTVSSDGSTITYQLPKLGATKDTTTGEFEYVDPLVSDGVSRTFTTDWAGGTIKDSVTGKIVCRYMYSKDPEKSSSQYNQAYAPFQLTTIGSARAVTITVVTREQVGTQWKWTRLKTTTLLRNYQ